MIARRPATISLSSTPPRGPAEARSPLVVDADAELPGTPPLERLEASTRRDLQVIEAAGYAARRFRLASSAFRDVPCELRERELLSCLEQSLARHEVDLEPDPVGILEEHRALPRCPGPLFRPVHDPHALERPGCQASLRQTRIPDPALDECQHG